MFCFKQVHHIALTATKFHLPYLSPFHHVETMSRHTEEVKEDICINNRPNCNLLPLACFRELQTKGPYHGMRYLSDALVVAWTVAIELHLGSFRWQWDWAEQRSQLDKFAALLLNSASLWDGNSANIHYYRPSTSKWYKRTWMLCLAWRSWVEGSFPMLYNSIIQLIWLLHLMQHKGLRVHKKTILTHHSLLVIVGKRWDLGQDSNNLSRIWSSVMEPSQPHDKASVYATLDHTGLLIWFTFCPQAPLWPSVRLCFQVASSTYNKCLWWLGTFKESFKNIY